ncbi:redoxin domain-containing protein [bacterium]|nr:redoxin domain-containing protein [bacterium]
MFRLLVLFAAALAVIVSPTTASAASPTAADSATTPALSLELFPPAGTVRIESEKAGIEKLLKEHNSDILVVNFWATWCGPCVEELPYFIALANRYPQDKVRVLGLSIDFPEQAETGVAPFLRTRKVPYSNVIVYMDDPQETIELFSDKWTGDLPATFFYDRSGKKLGELPFALTDVQLNQAVDALLAGEPLPAIKPGNH